MKTQFSVGLLGTLASMLLFIENVSAADFSINQAMYNSFCGYNPTATGSALCFDTDIDIRQHLKESTPGVVVYMTDDLKRELASHILASDLSRYISTADADSSIRVSTHFDVPTQTSPFLRSLRACSSARCSTRSHSTMPAPTASGTVSVTTPRPLVLPKARLSALVEATRISGSELRFSTLSSASSSRFQFNANARTRRDYDRKKVFR